MRQLTELAEKLIDGPMADKKEEARMLDTLRNGEGKKLQTQLAEVSSVFIKMKELVKNIYSNESKPLPAFSKPDVLKVNSSPSPSSSSSSSSSTPPPSTPSSSSTPAPSSSTLKSTPSSTNVKEHIEGMLTDIKNALKEISDAVPADLKKQSWYTDILNDLCCDIENPNEKGTGSSRNKGRGPGGKPAPEENEESDNGAPEGNGESDNGASEGNGESANGSSDGNGESDNGLSVGTSEDNNDLDGNEADSAGAPPPPANKGTPPANAKKGAPVPPASEGTTTANANEGATTAKKGGGAKSPKKALRRSRKKVRS
jgi:hypothetical protein